jgi:hypothetical protein
MEFGTTKQLFIIVFGIVFFFGILALSDCIRGKISADLIQDMAKMGYYQKEIDGNILWIKDEN